MDGADTYQAESYFTRFRRMVNGQHHFVTARYLYQYATEAAWKEDHRWMPNSGQFQHALRLALVSPKSWAWCGYWQRRHVAKVAE